MTKYGCRTKIFSDKDVRDALFDDKNEFQATEGITKFVQSPYLILEIATINNKEYISQYILNIIQTRDRRKKLTLIILKNTEAINNKYQDEDLNDYIFHLLNVQGAVVNK